MPRLGLIFTLVVAVGLACAGWFLLFRTRSMVPLDRGIAEESSPKGAYAGLAGKRWFPLLLRCQGILCWVVALALFGVAASAMMSH